MNGTNNDQTNTHSSARRVNILNIKPFIHQSFKNTKRFRLYIYPPFSLRFRHIYGLFQWFCLSNVHSRFRGTWRHDVTKGDNVEVVVLILQHHSNVAAIRERTWLLTSEQKLKIHYENETSSGRIQYRGVYKGTYGDF